MRCIAHRICISLLNSWCFLILVMLAMGDRFLILDQSTVIDTTACEVVRKLTLSSFIPSVN